MDYPSHQQSRKDVAALALGALGVVYGDIGTSPLYTMKEVFSGPHPIAPDVHNVLGILSLVFWALIIVVSLKYVVFILRADNRGEGGIMALMALVHRAVHDRPRLRWSLLVLGLFGAALFYGDGMITPAISVLSAVEGLKVATPALEPFVIPLALIVLVSLFLLQRRGTASVGGLFGPIMIVWFGTMGVLGLLNVMDEPSVLRAVNPGYAVAFFAEHKGYGFLVLGAVVLAVTGVEALYADMGHFGRRAIRLAWFVFVLPALVLNYFGQGALIIRDPATITNPFYLQAPEWAIYPLIALATAATVIASQAVISGTFSITRQAIQLGYLPRMDIRYTSEREIGQIYIPFMNWALLISVVALVLGFQSSSNLAAAYGIAVTGTMAIDTILAFTVVTLLWRWHPAFTVAGALCFLVIDLAFFGANAFKLFQGGWFPIVVAGAIFTALATWKRGRKILRERLKSEALELEPFLKSLAAHPPLRVPGTAVFLNAQRHTVPHALLHNLAHNKVLHERVVFLTVFTEDVPRVHDADRLEVNDLGNNFFRVVVHYGFKEAPNVPAALGQCAVCGHDLNILQTSFFLSRETLIPSGMPEMALWRERLFVWMARNAQSAMSFFRVPSNRVIELGTQVEL
jgi:KUP system potassium uptake protein